LSPNQRRWLVYESLRRLRGVDGCQTVILSFPRSGNHAVRYFLESISGRPTLSAVDHESFPFPKGLHDLPVLLGSRASGLAVAPVAIKRHRLLSIDDFKKLIYLERPLVEAVLSHGRNLSNEAFCDYAPAAIHWWRSLQYAFNSWPREDKFRLRYDDICSGDLCEFEKLADFMEIEREMVIRFFEKDSIGSARGVLGRVPGTESYERSFPERAIRVRSLLNEA
jgi:hypothetical protein